MKIEAICIRENESIISAMEKLDKLATKILFVVDNGKLKAALTDGDIRRWILSNGSLDAEVKNVANYNPLYLVNSSGVDVHQFLVKHRIEAVPIVNDDMIIREIVSRNENITKDKTAIDAPVVMMAGGKGTRLYPYTQILPKPLIPVGELPIAQHIINQYREYNCRDFYLIVNHKKNMIKAYFNEIEKDYNVFYVDEDVPLGTGGGLSLLQGCINETFILTNCDILVKDDFGKIYKLHKEKKHKITMVCSLKHFKIPYGIVEVSDSGEIENMREKPEISFLTNTGCYIVEPEILDMIEKDVYVGFPEVIEKCRNAGLSVGIYPISEGAWLDMGQMDELERMRNVIEQGQ